jgi:hypothetical protein
MQMKILLACLVISIASSGCAVGMLLFYRDARTTTIYKSTGSRKDHYEIKAHTLSHCGCTDLYVDGYIRKTKEFTIRYSDRLVSKIIYSGADTIRLLATDKNYTIPFDEVDKEIFGTIDSLLVNRPKGLAYPPQRRTYKGYVPDMR